ncbi:lytic transglycosylase domain-containing protein [Bradyrhizobium jicamae]|uniref:Lytic transglycosylase domain-containing protein n=1 Tax=Bradyrhizobium jicamae TaxID=280332 RepID=A0ABS5FE70_9BRAD|nr:lytic transglycosylase domain-containing protein [Bradyrhizobium jicamae]MBR0795097.1 lytic transglycosylase domain-containing protein [Bradyrhizobium jicamae]MBR0936971.1 lytic transglycosylase domain-containing protein [Bradyrhizobium jicamae]
MKKLQIPGLLAAIAVLALCAPARAQSRAQYETTVAAHARANLVPEELVHRVIVRESKYQPRLIGRGGAIGMMQIKLATARSLGYTGTAEGLRDAETNLTYGVKYLAGAYRAAQGDFDRAVRYFAGGYYYVAKHQRIEHLQEAKHAGEGAPPKELAKQDQLTTDTAEADPEQAAR